jgi:Transposase DDE domain
VPIEDYIIHVFCLIDDFMKNERSGIKLRKRGFPPALSDGETITIGLVGEFLGLKDDKAIWQYFRRHWSHWFPALGDRSTFVRQSANLWTVTQQLQHHFSKQLYAYEDDLHLCDGFPIPICHFKRSYGCKKFKGIAEYGYCASKDEHYYGFKGNLVISGSGIITGITATPANIDERDSLYEIVGGIKGLLIGDKGLIRPMLKDDLWAQNIDIQTPLRDNMKDDRDPKFVKTIVSTRRKVETVIGQLTDRFGIQKMKARDPWHMTNRIARKVASHTIAFFINKLINPMTPLQLDLLICQ